MIRFRTVALVSAALTAFVTAAGCSGGGGKSDGDGRIDELRVGGAVTYCNLSEDIPLSGVAVTLTDFDGDVTDTTTGADGLWEMNGVDEGVYTVGFSLAGYETAWDTAAVSQPEGSPSAFVDFGNRCLAEELATASVAPFGASVVNGQTLTIDDGGAPFVYDRSDDGDIVVTLSRPAPGSSFAFGGGGGGVPSVNDPQHGYTVYPTTISADRTVFTFSAAALDGVGGTGIGTNGQLNYVSFYNLTQFDPINGGQANFFGYLHFYAQP